MTFFFIFISTVIIQRIAELIISRKNEYYLKSIGAVEYDKEGYKYIVLLHVLFFVSIFTEFFLLERQLSQYWIVLITIFLVAQYIRYWAIATLGKRWSTKILVLQNAGLIKTGPYSYLRHPNYIAVMVEIAVIPLLFSCYYTCIIFSVLNFIALKRRIRIEEQALRI